jgi:2-oxoglutarate ferredoxin oxidoreductase subunit gamma
MTEEIIIAGFGGQGVLSMGMTLAYAGMIEGKQILWMPSYGPEMRGGTANCVTILSDDKISSPVVDAFHAAILLNQPSMDKFANRVKPGGFLLYECGSIPHYSSRKDVDQVGIPAMAEALKLNNAKIMNMIMLGAYLHRNPVVTIDSVMEALMKVLPAKYQHMLAANETALLKGEQLMHDMSEGVMMVC